MYDKEFKLKVLNLLLTVRPTKEVVSQIELKNTEGIYVDNKLYYV